MPIRISRTLAMCAVAALFALSLPASADDKELMGVPAVPSDLLRFEDIAVGQRELFCAARDLSPEECRRFGAFGTEPVFLPREWWTEEACAAEERRRPCALELHELNLSFFEAVRTAWNARLDERQAVLAQFPPLDFRGADLRGVDFRDRMLAGADFRGANLEGAWFFGAVLDNARFDGAILVDASFSGAELHGAHFVDATLDEASIFTAVGFGVDFSRASLRGAQLQGAIIVDSVFRNADLTRAYLSGTRLAGADLVVSRRWWKFEGGVISG